MADAEKSTLQDRMDGDYKPPILSEPAGGPIPAPVPAPEPK